MTTSNRMSHAQFFRLCEELRNRREYFEEKQLTLVEAARQLTKWLGFHVYDKKVRQAMTETGVLWHASRDVRPRNTQHSTNLVLAQAIMKLYTDLGASMPAKFAQLYETLSGHSLPPAAHETEPEPEPIPVSSVPDTKSIPVVDGKQKEKS